MFAIGIQVQICTRTRRVISCFSMILTRWKIMEKQDKGLGTASFICYTLLQTVVYGSIPFNLHAHLL